MGAPGLQLCCFIVFLSIVGISSYNGENPQKLMRMRRSYLQMSSEQIDSSEFGGPSGKKETTCPCGWANKAQKRIVGGRQTKPNEYPFTAALVDKYTNFLICGSAIVTEYHVLTGAHCTWRRRVEGDPIAVVIGEHDITKESDRKELIDVARIIEHPKFHRTTLINDIAVLVLAKKIEFNKFIGPVCLPTTRVNLDTKYVNIIGWGSTKKDGDGSPILKKVSVRVVNLQTCSYSYPGRVPTATPTHICTFGRSKGSCQGDSGGPVVWVDPETNRYTLVGLVSFGIGCGSTVPTVNTDVLSYYSWIQETIKTTSPSGLTCSKVN